MSFNITKEILYKTEKDIKAAERNHLPLYRYDAVLDQITLTEEYEFSDEYLFEIISGGWLNATIFNGRRLKIELDNGDFEFVKLRRDEIHLKTIYKLVKLSIFE